VPFDGKWAAVNPGEVMLCYPDEDKVLVLEDGRAIKTREYGARGYEPHRETCPYAPAKKRLRDESGADKTVVNSSDVKRRESQTALVGVEARAQKKIERELV